MQNSKLVKRIQELEAVLASYIVKFGATDEARRVMSEPPIVLQEEASTKN